jgi:membrane protease YdiL (CAAX protease family)
MTTEVRRLAGFVLGATAAVAVGIATGGMAAGLSGGLAPQRAAARVGLRYLRHACGDRAAIAMTAVAFGVYHVAGSGYWAIGAFFQFLMPSLGGVLFAWAAIRSKGLSLPIGLHLGGNWVQASVAGFHVGPSDAAADAIWRISITTADVQAITAPDFAVRLPYLTALAVAAALTSALLRVERSDRRMINT